MRSSVTAEHGENPVLFWTLAACAPPPLSITAPDGVRARHVEVTVAGSETTWWMNDVARDTLSPGVHTLDVAELPTGTHTLTFRSRTLVSRAAVVPLQITVDHSPPVVELGAVSRRVEQGHTLGLHLRTDEDANVSATFLDRERQLYPADDGLRALVGVPIRTPAGSHPLTLNATDRFGNQATFTVPIEVLPVDWPVTGKLPLSKSKATVPSESIVKMRSERDPIYAEDLLQPRFFGPMQLPLDGRHTSVFGSFREYPDGKRSHHDAEDISRKPGTPIVASADGIVRLARMQAVHGNATLLAHGQGVVSLYSHQLQHRVEEGDVVKAGQVIGLLGSTGRSTGPHLHWGVVVDEVPVDPMEWLEAGFLQPGAFTVVAPD